MVFTLDFEQQVGVDLMSDERVGVIGVPNLPKSSFDVTFLLG